MLLNQGEPRAQSRGFSRQCPRCGTWFRDFDEYVEHAWTEKP